MKTEGFFLGENMKYSTISQEFFDKFSFDGDELTHNKDEKRPYAIIIKLTFKGEKYDFALPFRSHIKAYFPEEQYFKLPPNHSTKSGEIHGLHYIKMFPIQKKYMLKYRFPNDKLNNAIQNKIAKNKKTIIEDAQKYLDSYSENGRPSYGVDIEGLIEKIISDAEK